MRSNTGKIIKLPLIFRHLTNGLNVIEVEGNTVEDCLKSLIKRFSDMEEVLFDKKGRVHNGIEIYLNGKTAFPDELVKPVKAGDEMVISLVLAGG